MMTTRGKLITLEGLDGAGKTTQQHCLKNHLESKGIEVLLTREPGGTDLGEKLRGLVLNESMSAYTELFLFFGARNHHIENVILPALNKGVWVICDRFIDASYAYQGAGKGVGFDQVDLFRKGLSTDLIPDLTLLLDIDDDLLVSRSTARRMVEVSDRFEQENSSFKRRVRQSYLDMADTCADRMVLIDGRGTEKAVSQRIFNIVSSFLK